MHGNLIGLMVGHNNPIVLNVLLPILIIYFVFHKDTDPEELRRKKLGDLAKKLQLNFTCKSTTLRPQSDGRFSPG